MKKCLLASPCRLGDGLMAGARASVDVVEDMVALQDRADPEGCSRIKERGGDTVHARVPLGLDWIVVFGVFSKLY